MEEECYRCGISGQEVRLNDAVYKEGLIKVCNDCAEIMNIPIIRKPTTFQLKAAEKPASVYERLARSRGLPIKKEVLKDKEEAERKRDEVRKYDVTLKDLINKRIKIQVEKRKIKGLPPKINLIDNFHWYIMKARRDRKISQEQLAQEINEAEMTIKMVEQGQLPEDDYRLINKLENYFKIHLIKESIEKNSILKKESPKRLSFDPVTLKNLTLADLKRMKDEREIKQKNKLQKEIEIEEKEIAELERDKDFKDIVRDENEIDWDDLKRKME